MTQAKPLPRVSLLLVYLACPPTGGAEWEGFCTFFSSGTDLCDYPNGRQGTEGQGRKGRIRKGKGKGGDDGEGEERKITRHLLGAYHILLRTPRNVFYFFGCIMLLVGSWFPNQGSNTGPQQ